MADVLKKLASACGVPVPVPVLISYGLVLFLEILPIEEARRWFEKSNDRGILTGKFILGFMRMLPEGGLKNLIGGMAMIRTSTSKGSAKAKAFLAKNDKACASFDLWKLLKS